MASDSNLIRASFGLGRAQAAANVPDMGPLYKAQAETYRQPAKIAFGIMDEMVKENKALKLAKTKQLQPLKNKFNEMYQSLFADKEPLPQSFVDAVEEQVSMLQDEFEAVNTIGKGDTRENERARNRIMGKFTKLRNSVVNFRGNLMKVSGAINDLDENNVQPEDIDPITFVSDIRKWDELVMKGDMGYVFQDGTVSLSVKNYRTGQRAITVDPAEQAVDEFGEVIIGDAERYEEYQYGDLITFNIEEMADRLPERPKALEAGIVANMNTSKTSAESHAKMEGAEQGGYMFDRDVNISKYNADLNDEKELQFLMKNSVSGIGGNSFHDDLLVSGIINKESALALGYDEDFFNMLDQHKDDKIDLKDKEMMSGQDRELWKYNTRTMIDAITNRYNSNYNFGLSKELFINWQVDREQQRYENSYDFAHKRANPGDYQQNISQYKLGREGFLFDPATGRDRQVGSGHKYNAAGVMMYDDDAVAAKIKKGEQFIDPFQNTYVPVEGGYHVIDGATNTKLKKLDAAGEKTEEDLFYDTQAAYRNAVGKTAKAPRREVPRIPDPISFSLSPDIKSNLFSKKENYKNTYDQLLKIALGKGSKFNVGKSRDGKSIRIIDSDNIKNTMSLKFGLSVEDAIKQMEEFNSFIQGLNK